MRLRVELVPSQMGGYYETDFHDLALSVCVDVVNRLMNLDRTASRIAATVTDVRPKAWRRWLKVKPSLVGERATGFVHVRDMKEYIIVHTRRFLEAKGLDLAKPFWVRFVVLKK